MLSQITPLAMLLTKCIVLAAVIYTLHLYDLVNQLLVPVSYSQRYLVDAG